MRGLYLTGFMRVAGHGRLIDPHAHAVVVDLEETRTAYYRDWRDFCHCFRLDHCRAVWPSE
jgi:hypothetical protein